VSFDNRCPHCDRVWGGIRYDITFGPLATRIIDAVENAGPDGIDHEELFSLIYGERKAKRTALKSYIGWINHEFRCFATGVRIRGRKGPRHCYYIERTDAVSA